MPPTIKPPKPAALPADALARAKLQKEQLADECAALEAEVEELKVKYEMYFLGVEKREPNKWREELKKKVLRVKEGFTRNAALRFRLQSLHARYLSYERTWLRSSREKEEGTYHRDVFKAKLHAEVRARKEREQAVRDRDPFATALAASAEKAAKAAGGVLPAPAALKPASPVAAAPRPAAPAPAAAGGSVADRQMKELYTAYIDAKRQCGEDVSRLTYDAVAKSVQKQVPEIMTRYKAKSVEFKVVVKDGKATLKAVPKS